MSTTSLMLAGRARHDSGIGYPSSRLSTPGEATQTSAELWSIGSESTARAPSNSPTCTVMSRSLKATASTAGR